MNSDFKADSLFSNEAMELGQIVRSSAVLGAGLELPPAASPIDWQGQPGTRAPHVLVTTAIGDVISSLDLLGREFVLFAIEPAWQMAADAMKLKFVHINHDICFSEPDTFAEIFGVRQQGAVLIRPDGIIAWRSNNTAEDGGVDELKMAFNQVTASPCQ